MFQVLKFNQPSKLYANLLFFQKCFFPYVPYYY